MQGNMGYANDHKASFAHSGMHHTISYTPLSNNTLRAIANSTFHYIGNDMAIYQYHSNLIIDGQNIRGLIEFAKFLKQKLIIKADEITFNSAECLEADDDITFISKHNIVFTKDAELTKKGVGNLYLKAGIGSEAGTIKFESTTKKQILMEDDSKVFMHYHPTPKQHSIYTHKYHNPSAHLKYVDPAYAAEGYMLVNNIDDLQNINCFLHGNYALSKSIDAMITKDWNDGKGFAPLMTHASLKPFSGDFDGNGFAIENLFINRPGEDNVGIFAIIAGASANHKSKITNLNLHNIYIHGNHYVGSVAGEAEYTIFSNITITGDSHIVGRSVTGGIVGTATLIEIHHALLQSQVSDFIEAEEYKGLYAGAIRHSKVYDVHDACQVETLPCYGFANDTNFSENN